MSGAIVPVCVDAVARTVSGSVSYSCKSYEWMAVNGFVPFDFTQHDFVVVAGAVTSVVLTALIFRLAARLLWGGR